MHSPSLALSCELWCQVCHYSLTFTHTKTFLWIQIGIQPLFMRCWTLRLEIRCRILLPTQMCTANSCAVSVKVPVLCIWQPSQCPSLSQTYLQLSEEHPTHPGSAPLPRIPSYLHSTPSRPRRNDMVGRRSTKGFRVISNGECWWDFVNTFPHLNPH